jgi:hypothetical protein
MVHKGRWQMRQRLRTHLSYAKVMVTLLGFIALGGTAYAAATGKD